MSRDYKLYLEDMLQAARKITGYVEGIEFQALIADSMRLEAVLFNLQIIGEATKQIPDDMRAQYSAVEWRKIAGLRDIIAHGYFSIDARIIWDVIQNKLPELCSQVEKILEEPEPPPDSSG